MRHEKPSDGVSVASPNGLSLLLHPEPGPHSLEGIRTLLELWPQGRTLGRGTLPFSSCLASFQWTGQGQ